MHVTLNRPTDLSRYVEVVCLVLGEDSEELSEGRVQVDCHLHFISRESFTVVSETETSADLRRIK